MNNKLFWKDSRLFKPSVNSYNKYPVLFLCSSSIFQGIGEWMPTNNYTDGEWTKTTCTNGNPLQGTVLYWHDWLDIPEELK